jgi:hypothetical protein
MPRPGATQEVLVDEQRGHESWRVTGQRSGAGRCGGVTGGSLRGACTRGRPRFVTDGVLRPGARRGWSSWIRPRPATVPGVVRVFRDQLPGCEVERFGMCPAVMLCQDLAEVAGPVRDGLVAELAAGDR